MEETLQQLTIREDDPLTRENVLLVEWQDASPVVQMVEIEGRVMETKGIRPRLIADGNSKVLVRYDSYVDGLIAGDDQNKPPTKVGFSPLVGREGAFLASIAAPSAEVPSYHWYLQRLCAFIDNDNVHIIFGRPATVDESIALDGFFFLWRQKVVDLSEELAKMGSRQRAIDLSNELARKKRGGPR
jgi:hypothetical protein